MLSYTDWSSGKKRPGEDILGGPVKEIEVHDSFASIPIVIGSVADDPGLDLDCPYFTRAGM